MRGDDEKILYTADSNSIYVSNKPSQSVSETVSTISLGCECVFLTTRLTVDCDLDTACVWRRHTVVGDAFKFLCLMPLDFCDFQKFALIQETICEDKRREGD